MRRSCGTVLAADGQVTDRAWDGQLSSVAFAPKAIARPHIAIETDAKQRRAPDREKIIILTITSIGWGRLRDINDFDRHSIRPGDLAYRGIPRDEFVR
jgi:hypothetical protein